MAHGFGWKFPQPPSSLRTTPADVIVAHAPSLDHSHHVEGPQEPVGGPGDGARPTRSTRTPPRGRRHDLAAVLAVGLAAVISGARSFVAIGEWVAHQPLEVLRSLGVTGATAPVESTIRRTFACLDSDVLDQILAAFMWTRTHTVGQRRVIALDGKTVRGARSRITTAPHLVAALDHGT